MAILRGFPSSNTIAPGVRIAEKDQSFIAPEQSFHRAGLVGYASKGPINVPTLIQSSRQLHTVFGNPHPSNSDPYLIYAAEQYLFVANELLVVRVADTDAVSDEAALTASKAVPSSGGAVVAQSDTAGTYSFSTDQFFRWKLNGVLASKTLVVLDDSNEVTFVDTDVATKAAAAEYTCEQLAATLNEQLDAEDGIEFTCNSSKLAVQSTFSFGVASTIELVSVEDQMYGPSSVTGLGTTMTVGSTTGSEDQYPNDAYHDAGDWDFTNLTDSELIVVIDGTDNVLIDNIAQTIDLSALDGSEHTTAEVVTEINDQIATLPGGFEAVAVGDNVKLQTLHAGKDAKLLVKSSSNTASVFGFSGATAAGTSPSGSTGASSHTFGIVAGTAGSAETTFTLKADSPGIEGNSTQVVISNDDREGTFKFEVYNNSVNVESWGNIVKDEASRYYVGTFLDLVSQYISIDDVTSVAGTPLAGTYDLAGGTDGIPADADTKDLLLVGTDIGFTGIYALSEPEQYEIDLIAAPGHSSTTVVAGLIKVAEGRGDCLAIVDPPFSLTVNEIIDWHNGSHPLNTLKLNSDFAALYWPWVKIRDTYNGVDVWVPPSGGVMAAIARNDQIEEPWFAPAGTTRGQIPGISDVKSRPSAAERDLMYGNRSAINPIMQYAGSADFVIMGQKTLQRRPTALDRVNVRRLMFTIQKRLRVASRELLFDQHDEQFRNRFTQIASSILTEVQVGRGITDYIIQADDEINTADVVDRNEFRARIGIQPTKAVEFIFLEFSLHRTGSFGETSESF